MSTKYYKHGAFELESGEILPELTVAYNTYGEYRGDNAVWVCHALTANSDLEDWWPSAIKEGSFLDPAKKFTVCANILGSCYGTTGPLSINPKTAEPYYGDFPFFTVRDIAKVQLLLADHLGINEVKTIVGGSIGGFQAMEMELIRPGFAKSLLLLATTARSQPWAIAFNESQRMAIEADSTFGEPSKEAGLKGMRAARAIGLLSYRGPVAFNDTQQERDEDFNRVSGFRATTYQQYQGDKLCERFDAYTYYALTLAFDTHNVGRERGSVEAALAQIKCPTLIVAFSTDILFPIEEQIELYRLIENSEIRVMGSDFGHDGFLVEFERLNKMLIPFLNKL